MCYRRETSEERSRWQAVVVHGDRRKSLIIQTHINNSIDHLCSIVAYPAHPPRRSSAQRRTILSRRLCPKLIRCRRHDPVLRGIRGCPFRGRRMGTQAWYGVGRRSAEVLEGRGHGEVWGTSRARVTKSGPEPERDDSIKSGHMVQYVLLSGAIVARENKKMYQRGNRRTWHVY